MSTPLTEEQTAELIAEVEAFLLDRHFTRVDPRDITGCNTEYEFHIYCGKKAVDVTLIHRFEPEYVDQIQIPYGDKTIIELYNLIGR